MLLNGHVLLCWLVYLCLWIIPGNATVSLSKSPTMNIKDLYIDVPSNSTLHLNCTGTEYMQWSSPQHEDTTSDDSRLEKYNSVDTSKSVSRYTSQLILKNISYMDTGWYSCYYKSDRNQASSVYVFVNDPVNLLLEKSRIPGQMFVLSQQNKKTVIACLPSSSRAKVTLWKTENDKGKGEVVQLGQDVQFEPTQGFILFYPTIYFSGLFQCRAELDNHEQDINITIIFFPDTMIEPRPSIDASEALHPTTNSTFILKCSVAVDPGTRVFFDWSYPNKNSHRINETVAVSTTKNVGIYVQQEITAHLVVTQAVQNDSGIYRCTVTDHAEKMGYDQVQIIVYEFHQPSHVNFTTDIDLLQPVVYEAGQTVKFVITIQAYPSLSDVVLYWMKDGRKLLADDRIQQKITSNVAKLEISELLRTDSGIYTFVGEVANTSNSLSITLNVKDKPIVTVSGVEFVYELNETYTLECHANGYPTPVVWWRWKPCLDIADCSLSDNTSRWMDVEDGNIYANSDYVIPIWYGPRNFSALVLLRMVAKQSGHYLCMASNVMGYDEELVTFIVTDAKEGFEITAPESSPVNGDDVSLSCKVNAYNYTHVSWKWQHVSALDPSNDLCDISGVLCYNESSEYSHLSVVHFSPIHLNSSGKYFCVATSNSVPEFETQSIEIEVKEIIKPILNSTNMKGKVASAPQGSVQEFYCYVFGLPQPHIIWQKDHHIFDPNNITGIEVLHNGQALVMKRVLEKDAGFYECRAENRGGTISANITLEVLSDDEAFNILSANEVIIIVALVIIGLFLFILSSLFIRRVQKDRKQKKELAFINQNMFERGYIEIFNPNLPLQDQVDLLPYKQQWEFPKERLRLGKTLGQGAFGRVVKAEAVGLVEGEASTTVAVKMLKETANKEQRRALIAELKILVHLGRHLNIVNLLGAVTKGIVKGELMIVVEYCRFGNLRQYLLKNKEYFIDQFDSESTSLDYPVPFPSITSSSLQDNLCCTHIFDRGMDNPSYGYHHLRYADLLRHCCTNENSMPSDIHANIPVNYQNDNHREKLRSNSNEDGNIATIITTCDLLCYAFQCARGMEYLSSRKLIHRDLAARNVLLTDGNIVKICDFGLSKDCYKYSNYVIKTAGLMPIKWMAVESIRDKVFTTKSDVWSFGVLLWEIFTLGGNPYPGIEVNDEFFKKLKNGYRMEKPDYSPDSMYQIMRDCWLSDPNQRPGFTQLSEKIGLLLEAGVRKYYMELNAPYEVMNEEYFNNNDYLEMNKDCESYTKMANLTNEPNNDLKLLQNTYDNIGSLRPVGNGPAPKVPMEVVPMIQLESLSEKDTQLSDAHSNSVSDTNTDSSSCHNSNSEKQIKCDEDNDSVFYQSENNERFPKYVNGIIRCVEEAERSTQC